MRKSFFFDLDDTLMPNQHYYKLQQGKLIKFIIREVFPENRAALRAANQLLDEILDYGYRCPPLHQIISQDIGEDGTLLEDILSTEQRINIENVERYKKKFGEPYHRTRVPRSCRETYSYYCKEKGMTADKESGERAYQIGAEVFEVEPRLMWGAKKALDFLSSKDDELYVLTKGDAEIQNHKLELNRIDRWIPKDRWHIVSEKSARVYSDKTRSKDRSECYMIGNSLKSDIIPALTAGMNAVYIPFYTWAFEEADLSGIEGERYALDPRGEVMELENGRKLFILNNITDLIPIYEDL